MDGSNKPSFSDDEEDLEALRLAALQSLKKNAPSQALPGVQQGQGIRKPSELRTGNRMFVNFSNKRGRFFSGRGAKNGQFHGGRFISSNLISLTPSSPREVSKVKHIEGSSGDSLTLPQDRYNSKAVQDTKSEEMSSKFDRYKDSDNSEEEDSEDEVLKSESDDDSPLKLERSDSLEALMQELDNEIQGKNKVQDKEKKIVKGKPKIKKKKEVLKIAAKDEAESKAETEAEVILEEMIKEEKGDNADKKDEDDVPSTQPESTDGNKSTLSPKNDSNATSNKEMSESEPQLKKRRHTPPSQREFRGYRGKPHNFRRSPPLHNHIFLPNDGPLPFPPNNLPPIYINPPFAPPNLMTNPPPFYERPLSPLLINAETLQNQTMAPLSPRSAAFVLKNRAIIEKRKRSPRRSYSRSPSPRRRSLSPRRSLTPLRKKSMSPPRKRSLSPRKRSLSPPRKRSRSPKRRSVSPKRRSPSPKRRTFSPKQRPLSPKSRPLSPKRRSPSPKRRSVSPRRWDRKEASENASKIKPSVRDRLGFKPSLKLEDKVNKDKPSTEASPVKEDKTLDPVLEARKKKFETKEIKMREGVIRLKPKDEIKQEKVKTPEPEEPREPTSKLVTAIQMPDEVKQTIEEDVINEDVLLEDDELDLEAQVDLFSEDDTGSENEGRFKTKLHPDEKPTVLPFSKLMNGTKKEDKTAGSTDSKPKKEKARSRSPIEKSKSIVERDPVSSRSNSATRARESKAEKSSTRKKLGVKAERHPKKFERKIEIKIKYPSKYERADKTEGEKKEKTGKERGVRKVELGTVSKREGNEEDDETEIVVENDEDEVENNASNEGDLRAQLSKKRAEKMHKITSHKGVSSRLLQNALQNALPIKKSKKSKSKELSSSELASIKSLFTADFIASRLKLTVRSKRHVTVYKNKKFKFGFKSSAPTADGKLPIQLRLGLACDSDVFNKPKRKSKKRKNVEREGQV